MLTDTHIKQEVQSATSDYFVLNDNGAVFPSVLWDAGKATVRGKIISIGSRLKKQRLIKQLELETEIKRLEREHKQSRKEEVLKKLKEARLKLDEALTYKAEGAFRFTDRKYYEMGNKASRLLAFQFRKAQASRIIPRIRHPDINQIETCDVPGKETRTQNAGYNQQSLFTKSINRKSVRSVR